MPSSPGEFTYPPSGSNLQFNSVDSVVASWSTFDPNPTDCTLSVYYWPDTEPWRLGYNQTASANGTATVPLDIADGSSYIGQLNFFYTDSEGGREKYLGPLFDVAASSQAGAPHTWSLPAAARTSSTSPTSSTALQTSIWTSLVISDVSPATVTVSNQVPTVLSPSATSSPLSAIPDPSSTRNTHLGGGAIAGIVVGAAVLCAGLAAALIYHRRRKSTSARAQLQASASADFKFKGPVHFVGEKHGSPLRSNELAGDGQYVEMPSDGR